MVVDNDLQYLCQFSIGTEVQLTLFLLFSLMLSVLAGLSIRRLVAAIPQVAHNLADLGNVINLDVPPVLNLLEKGLILAVLFLEVAQHGQPGRVVGF